MRERLNDSTEIYHENLLMNNRFWKQLNKIWCSNSHDDSEGKLQSGLKGWESEDFCTDQIFSRLCVKFWMFDFVMVPLEVKSTDLYFWFDVYMLKIWVKMSNSWSSLFWCLCTWDLEFDIWMFKNHCTWFFVCNFLLFNLYPVAIFSELSYYI